MFWVAAAMLFCTTAAEWCITAWGASFVEDAADVSADTAVALMVGYFVGVVAGPRARQPARAPPSAAPPARARAGRHRRRLRGPVAVGEPGAGARRARCRRASGLGNLFPLGLAVTVALAPDRAQLACGRAVLASALAVLLAPLTVGALADATSLTAALAVVPVMLVLAAVGLTLVSAYSTRSKPPARTASRRPVRHPRTASRTSGVGRSR